MGGRSDLFNSGGRWSKGGEGIVSKFSGELAKRGVKKFRGVWTLDEVMDQPFFPYFYRQIGCLNVTYHIYKP